MVLCYKVALEHWQQGWVSKSLEWVFLFDFFIACNFKQFRFLLLHGSVCVKRSHTANNGKQRTRLPADLPHIKTKLARVSDTLEACYHNDQAEKCKITNAYKVFSFRSCVLAAWCSFFKWCGFNLAVCCEFQWRYSLARPEFIKLSRRRRFHILHRGSGRVFSGFDQNTVRESGER